MFLSPVYQSTALDPVDCPSGPDVVIPAAIALREIWLRDSALAFIGVRAGGAALSGGRTQRYSERAGRARVQIVDAGCASRSRLKGTSISLCNCRPTFSKASYTLGFISILLSATTELSGFPSSVVGDEHYFDRVMTPSIETRIEPQFLLRDGEVHAGARHRTLYAEPWICLGRGRVQLGGV